MKYFRKNQKGHLFKIGIRVPQLSVQMGFTMVYPRGQMGFCLWEVLPRPITNQLFDQLGQPCKALASGIDSNPCAFRFLFLLFCFWLFSFSFFPFFLFFLSLFSLLSFLSLLSFAFFLSFLCFVSFLFFLSDWCASELAFWTHPLEEFLPVGQSREGTITGHSVSKCSVSAKRPTFERTSTPAQRNPWGRNSTLWCGDVSKPILLYLGGWTSIYQLFDVHQGDKVLTHCHVSPNRNSIQSELWTCTLG